jgi:DNA-binding CsgD family transcriptional regulator
MVHLILLYYAISLFSGLTLLILLSLLYRKYNNEIIIFYAPVHILILIYLVIVIADFYRFNAMGLPILILSDFYRILIFISGAVLLILVSRFVYAYFRKPFYPTRWLLFILWSSVMLLTIPVMNSGHAAEALGRFGITDMAAVEAVPYNALLAAFQAYIAAFVLHNMNTLKRRREKILITLFMSFFFSQVPLRIWEDSWRYDPNFFSRFGNVSAVHGLFLLWNCAAIYFAAHYLLKKNPLRLDISDRFREEYAISARELEVIALLLKGFSHKEIAFELGISALTIKNHVHNIYRKTGATSKIELLNLLQ